MTYIFDSPFSLPLYGFHWSNVFTASCIQTRLCHFFSLRSADEASNHLRFGIMISRQRADWDDDTTAVRFLIPSFLPRNRRRLLAEFLSFWVDQRDSLRPHFGYSFHMTVTVAPDMAAANFVHQYFHEGYIVFTEGNNTGKICVDSLNSSSLMSTARQQSFLEIFGESACRSMSYRIMERIEIRIDNERSADYAHLTEPIRWRATFLRAPCRKRQVLYLSCSGLGKIYITDDFSYYSDPFSNACVVFRVRKPAGPHASRSPRFRFHPPSISPR